jgi:hypothetical protein
MFSIQPHTCEQATECFKTTSLNGGSAALCNTSPLPIHVQGQTLAVDATRMNSRCASVDGIVGAQLLDSGLEILIEGNCASAPHVRSDAATGS